MIPAFLNNFFTKHNLRPFEFTWLLYVHVLGLIGFVYFLTHFDKTKSVLPYFLFFWVAYAMGITGGAHRLWAHKSYSASTPLKIFWMLLNSGANQGSIYHWSRDHRLHHKFSDTELDPHTISKGFFFAHVGWLLLKKNPQLIAEGKKIDMSDLQKDAIVMWQKKYYPYISTFMCFIVPTVVYCWLGNVPLLAAFAFSMFTYAWVLNITWCVNSICHMFGSRPWNNKI
jgi:stearoyl-CoA desaturase (delta-9 desaturase)